MPLFLGLDCGGSTCRAMALDEAGEPAFLAQGGSANLAATPDITLERSLHRALDGLPPVDYVCACFAGLVGKSSRLRAEEIIRRFIPSAPLRLEPDYAAALRACPDGAPVCVVAGTGSIVCSRVNGELRKSGGGGYLLGDEGSGFRYGRAGLRQYLRDPESASDAIRECLASLFRSFDPGEITMAVYGASAPNSLVAGVASAVFRDAEMHKPYALETIDQETAALARVTADHIRRFHPELSAPVVGLAGGTWKKKLVRDAFGHALMREIDGARIVRGDDPPVKGAALLAMEMHQR